MQARNFDLPVQLDSKNQINRGESRWTDFDPNLGAFFPDANELGTEIDWGDYSHLCVVESTSKAINLVQTFENLLEAGVHNGLGESNWKTIFLRLSEGHLKTAHSAISRKTDNLRRASL